MTPTRWHPERTTELLNLLQVLGRLVDLEAAQADLPQRVIDNPQISDAALNAAGVLPPPQGTRKLPSGQSGNTLFDD